MVQVGRRWMSMRRMALMALTLALSAACRADAAGPAAPEAATVAPASEADVKPGAPNADTPRARVHRPPTYRTVGQGIDENVRRLTRGLDLNPEQQAKLRQILLDQHRQLMKLRNENSELAADRAGANLAILDKTKARIRAMLNEEQQKKYSTDVPRDQNAPAQADLQHWMELQESKRRQGEAESN
jgi:hypothetical protein